MEEPVAEVEPRRILGIDREEVPGGKRRHSTESQETARNANQKMGIEVRKSVLPESSRVERAARLPRAEQRDPDPGGESQETLTPDRRSVCRERLGDLVAHGAPVEERAAEVEGGGGGHPIGELNGERPVEPRRASLRFVGFLRSLGIGEEDRGIPGASCNSKNTRAGGAEGDRDRGEDPQDDSPDHARRPLTSRGRTSGAGGARTRGSDRW